MSVLLQKIKNVHNITFLSFISLLKGHRLQDYNKLVLLFGLWSSNLKSFKLIIYILKHNSDQVVTFSVFTTSSNDQFYIKHWKLYDIPTTRFIILNNTKMYLGKVWIIFQNLELLSYKK